MSCKISLNTIGIARSIDTENGFRVFIHQTKNTVCFIREFSISPTMRRICSVALYFDRKTDILLIFLLNFTVLVFFFFLNNFRSKSTVSVEISLDTMMIQVFCFLNFNYFNLSDIRGILR